MYQQMIAPAWWLRPYLATLSGAIRRDPSQGHELHAPTDDEQLRKICLMWPLK
jgi:hypothetical protein